MSSKYTYPTWSKYIVMYKHIDRLRVKDKRYIFQLMRTNEHMDQDTYFPEYGFTAGEFAIWQVLSENIRKKDSKTKMTATAKPDVPP